MKGKFMIDEMVFKGILAYFPIKKVAFLLNVNEDEIEVIASRNGEIVENSITITDNNTNEVQVYLNPVGVALFIMGCEDYLGFGKGITESILSVVNAVQKKRPEEAKRVLSVAHPFVRTFFDWAHVYPNVWAKLPVQ